MDMEVLDIHTQLLHRCFVLLGVVLNKLSFVCLGLYLTAIQQTLLSHQPLDLFFVDHKTLLPKTGSHYSVTIVNKLNAKDKLYSNNQADIADLIAILHEVWVDGFRPFFPGLLR